MILLIGGLGFIGTNTAEAFVEMGETCVLTQHTNKHVPEFLKDRLGKSIFIEKADITNLETLLTIGKRYKITHIVHLAGGGFIPENANVIDTLRADSHKLFNVLQLAHYCNVKRLIIASTIGVYNGVYNNPLREEATLSMVADHPIPVAKKIYELTGGLVSMRTGMDVVFARIAAIWGPMGRPRSVFFSVPQLVHAVAKGKVLIKEAEVGKIYAEDGGDLCYVKDCGRGLALLTMAATLNHRVYNIGSGCITRNKEIVRALQQIKSEVKVELTEGHTPDIPDLFMDIEKLKNDTGYEPKFNIQKGISDYLKWLLDGNER